MERGAHLEEQEGGIPLNNAVWAHSAGMITLLLGFNADPNLLGGYVRILRLQFLLICLHFM